MVYSQIKKTFQSIVIVSCWKSWWMLLSSTHKLNCSPVVIEKRPRKNIHIGWLDNLGCVRATYSTPVGADEIWVRLSELPLTRGHDCDRVPRRVCKFLDGLARLGDSNLGTHDQHRFHSWEQDLVDCLHSVCEALRIGLQPPNSVEAVHRKNGEKFILS